MKKSLIYMFASVLGWNKNTAPAPVVLVYLKDTSGNFLQDTSGNFLVVA